METAAISTIPGQDKKTVVRFADGLYGFEDVKDYVLLQEGGTQMIWSLQAAGRSYPSFIVVNPFLIVKDYKLSLTEEDCRVLGEPADGDLCCLAVAVIKKNLPDSVVNLKSPIVINVKTKIGRQIIMEDSDYPVRYHLFKKHE